jgi:hypothetical protein
VTLRGPSGGHCVELHFRFAFAFLGVPAGHRGNTASFLINRTDKCPY